MPKLELGAFTDIALRAFPYSCAAAAREASLAVAPFFDAGYRMGSVEAIVLGETVKIPERIHFLCADADRMRVALPPGLVIDCLLTRSTDGYVRQSSLRRILRVVEPWIVPYAVLLSGEYVVEIIEDMVAALPALDRDAYVGFVRENRPLMRLLTSKATSYWNCYCRQSFPDRRGYPGLTFLRELERWAA